MGLFYSRPMINHSAFESDTTSNSTSHHTLFYLVRHGQTDWNREDRLQGHTDIPLNEMGRMQAIQLSEQLKDIPFHAVFSSDLKRAFETASLIVGSRSFSIKTDPRIRERNFGSWEGLTVDYIQFLKQTPADIETDSAMIERSLHFLNETAQRLSGQTVLVVAHGGLIRTLLYEFLQLHHQKFSIEVKNTALVKISFNNGKWKVEGTQGVIMPEIGSAHEP